MIRRATITSGIAISRVLCASARRKTMQKKADIQAALKAAFAYCDGAFQKLDDQSGREMIDLMGQRRPRLIVLAFNTQHTWELYGNLVRYFRLKDMVPPSSQRGM